MVAPILGLPALLKAIATIGVGGAVGYKAQKSLKDLNIDPKNFEEPQLKMLRALFLPSQAVGTQVKEDLISKSAPAVTPGGQVFGPDAGEIEKERERIREITKPPVNEPKQAKPIIETFPAETPPKQEPPIQPEIDLETKETFPDDSEIKPIIFYNKTKEYEGPIVETNNLDDNLQELIAKYAGTREQISESIKMPQSHKKKIFFALEKAIQEKYPTELSSEESNVEGDALFYITQSVYDSYTSKDGKVPNNVVMAQDDAGIPLAAANIEVFPEGKVSFYPKRKVKRVKTEPAIYIETIGSLNREATENVLNQIEKLADAQGIRYVVAEDLTSEAAEKAFKNRGFVPAKKGFFEGEQIKTADWRGGKTIIQKNMVLDLGKKNKTTETEIAKEAVKEQLQTPAIIGTTAQEGGKQIKDITAGFSIQKDIVPSLLEQGKAAIPMKNFFEKDANVINYKVGDTIGAYGGDVERSLDIEANVKPDFNIDNFSEVIKQGAKEYNQDAVFVAESAPPEKANTVGFSIDFGSNLNIADALEVSKRISETAKLDGFTFKIKNLNTSGASIYLPQEKDLEMTQKVMEKFKPTDQINLAGFMMPDGKMLNFSRGGNVRDTEHRRIGLVTHPGSDGISFGPMYDFMNKTGAIRLAGNTNRLYAEISGKPSTTQIRKIAEEYNKNRNKYDSLTIALAIPKTEGALGGVKPEEAIDLNKMTYRLPNEAFIEINGTEANANDIFKKFQAADVMGKTFTGIRQLNIPEFSNMSAKDAAKKIVNLGNNLSKIIEETGIKTLDKPKSNTYNMKLFQKGKDY
jgi:hypothetical protein|tara:strand:- start:8492 stop:10903 length:2412 start_codon:yes stop_codon:yes gene_type:complete